MIREPEQVMEMALVRHEGLPDTWMPRSALRQLGASGWAEIEPPARGADGELLEPEPVSESEPASESADNEPTDDAPDDDAPADDAAPKRKARTRAAKTEE
jgi:hypothetical protein